MVGVKQWLNMLFRYTADTPNNMDLMYIPISYPQANILLDLLWSGATQEWLEHYPDNSFVDPISVDVLVNLLESLERHWLKNHSYPHQAQIFENVECKRDFVIEFYNHMKYNQGSRRAGFPAKGKLEG